MIAVAPPLLAAAVVLIGALRYEPTALVLTWPNGHVERLAATSPEVCRAAIRAIVGGLWRPAEVEPAAARCEPGDLFAVDSTCIHGYSCPEDRR